MDSWQNFHSNINDSQQNLLFAPICGATLMLTGKFRQRSEKLSSHK